MNKKFKRFYQFGFTGTPIFPLNALGAETTASVFGRELHSYVITDAIRDEKVLKFKVDYNDVRHKFKAIETEQDVKKLSAAENKEALLHPERIREISQYILNNYRQKTHRLQTNAKGFNAMFAVSSVDAAKLYYESLNNLQTDPSNKNSEKPLKIATIFSFAANEEQDAVGDILDESFDIDQMNGAMNSSAKEFLNAAIGDYNAFFKTNFSVDSNGFQNYYRDLAKRVKTKEIDLLIVVGMFLTGFDAPTLNTLFVDKNLRFHGLMQAFSRTNRIYDATKTFGNIVTFRDLEIATVAHPLRLGIQLVLCFDWCRRLHRHDEADVQIHTHSLSRASGLQIPSPPIQNDGSGATGATLGLPWGYLCQPANHCSSLLWGYLGDTLGPWG